ncbi:MAG: HEAT repeat domain-containing protein [Candidatus Anammoximicrobium sp.]|nr:HEAT repeat domain-containing protein [Candidatus Anammoximicrobium sp.]
MDENLDRGSARHEFGGRQFPGRPRAVHAAALVLELALGLGLLAGCGSDANTPAAKAAKPGAAKTSASRTSRIPAKARPLPAPSVPADAFPDLAAAIQALTTAAKASDTPSFVRAEQWIVMQGDAGVEPLGQIVNDPQAQMEHRIAVCRTLRRLGTKAKAAFKQALTDKSQQIRLNAIKSLGLIEPTDQDIIQTLDGYLGNKDVRTRTEAIFALANIGPPAKDAVGDKLVKMLNDPKEQETIRGAARRALDEVAPRRTFLDR